MRKFSHYLIISIIVFLFAITGAEAGFPLSVYLKTDRLSFDSEKNIFIEVHVKNMTESTVSFMVYEPEYTTFQPIVYDMTGREAQTKVSYRLENKRCEEFVKPLTAREVTLAAGETIIRRMNLNDYYVFKPDTKYKVGIFFLPDAKIPVVLKGDNKIFISTIVPVENKIIKDAIVQDKGIAPSEIVRLFLSAEKNKEWRNYIKYINYDKYINSFPDFSTQYSSTNDAIKEIVLKNFKTYLTTPRNDFIIDYEIVDETISDKNIDKMTAVVKAKVKREGAGKPFIYVYSYELEKFSDYWQITNVTATVTRENKK